MDKKYCKKCGTLLQESSKFCSRCGTAAWSQSQNTQVVKPDTVTQESTGKVNLKKTEGVSCKGKADLKKPGEDPKQADTAAMSGTGFESSGGSDAGNLSGTGFENPVHTNAGYSSGTGMQNRTGTGAGKRQNAEIENRIGSKRDRRKKVLIRAAVCAAVLAGILSVAQFVQKEDSSMDSAQQDETWTGAAWQPEDTPEQEEELLEEQRRQEELLEEQRRREELLEEQRRQEELLAEQDADKAYETFSDNFEMGPNIDVEGEVLSIRDKYNRIMDKVMGGQLNVSIITEGVTAYQSDDSVQAVFVNKGVDGYDYSRKYYFDDNHLMFAYYEGSDAHRLYFKNDKLFRWRYSPVASNPQDAENYDGDYADGYQELEDYAVHEGYTFLNDVEIANGEGERG